MPKSESTKQSTNKNTSKGFKASMAAFVRRIGLTTATIALSCLLLSVGSIYIAPTYCSVLGLMGLTFPVFWALNLLVWIVLLPFTRRISLIPLFGLIITASHAFDYCPINLPTSVPENSIKVMTYNTHGFGNFGDISKTKDKEGRNKIALYMAEHNPDIIAYQEGVQPWSLKQSILPVMKKKKFNHDNISYDGFGIGCFSRFPIVDKEIIGEHDSIRAAVFKLLKNPNDTIFLVVTHLQSMGLDTKDRNNFKHNLDYITSDNKDFKARSMWQIIKKVASASQPRARQAQKVAQYIEAHANEKLIVCGDFNETPISYPYQKIINAGPLNDAFVESGRGIGRSFNKNGLVVRIDHILYNRNHWKAHATKVMNDITLSDHYAVITHLTEVTQ
ncbi:MAG: endonuclease/exonuclease/phosphatase family protein [Bacteroidaceae bacterium]|nr:endonuclease/exonuclease/phosphatase family protein [Bacteroidaceae bacterium]